MGVGPGRPLPVCSPATPVPPLHRPLPGWRSLLIHITSHQGLEQDMGSEKGEEMLGKLKRPVALGEPSLLPVLL